MGKNGDMEVEVEVMSRHQTGYVSLWRDGGGGPPESPLLGCAGLDLGISGLASAPTNGGKTANMYVLRTFQL